MLKNKNSNLSHTLQGLSTLDKWNILIVCIFFIVALILPIAYISPLSSEAQTITIRAISFEYRKTSIVIIVLLTINTGMSLNWNFKSFFLQYTWMGNEIYIRFLQKWVLFVLLLLFGEVIIHLRLILTQTLNLWLGYYILWWVIIIWLWIDFLFLHRNYKINKAHINSRTSIIHDENNDSNRQSFKNLFDE